VWVYTPDSGSPDRGTLKLLYAAAASVAGNNPDNIVYSPRGGILTCDDGAAVDDGYGPGNRLMGYRTAGEAYIFGKNNVVLSDADIAKMGRTGQFEADDYRDQEFAGATFDPAGHTLFVNIQTPGLTAAIRGPWARGNL
jgi:secreted PhoX family phosphatase